MSTNTDAVINSVAATFRGWRGSLTKGRDESPAIPLKLYDIEACPYCRLVRETLTELDLDAMILPCPKSGTRFRSHAGRLGPLELPLLVDENTGATLHGSTDIIDYLGRTYGGPAGPRGLRRRLAVVTSQAATALLFRPHGMTGLHARPSVAPKKPLELFSFESSPYSKRVRARLCELEIPYLLRNTAKGHWKDLGPPVFRDRLFKGEQGTTRNRRWLSEHTGRVQVPYLIDPNTGAEMYESQDILDYLDRTYAA